MDLPGQHLEPSRPLLSGRDAGSDYYLILRDRLLGDQATSPCLRVVCVVPLAAEWAVKVRKSAADMTRVDLLVAETSLCESASPKSVPIHETRADLSSATAARLEAVWLRMLMQTRYAVAPNDVVDAAMYEFAAFDREFGELNGRTCSAPADSRAGRLVALADKLRAFVEAPESEQPAIEEDLGKGATERMATLDEANDSRRPRRR